ncbi:MAG: flagellar biosynthesis protein FliQ [Gammaproteobacteria bacterium]|nr:MAG: flagellar biosynthesis protein FliQ [Gammaproteobacteria bacterium]
MGPEAVIDVGRHALEVILLLLGVILVPALGVGLIISMFQAATQINEMTLSFVPKLLVTISVLIAAGPWMLRLLTEYTQRLFDAIPFLIG